MNALMQGMIRVKTVAIAVLLLSYGAVGGRQPAVRTSVPLPAAASDIASALGLDSADRSRLLLSIVRLVFDAPDGQNTEDTKLRAKLDALLRGGAVASPTTVPLPLDPSIWRETLLGRQVPDAEIATAILSDRSTALLYHGLAALDDETLGWLGPDRETLLHLKRHAAVFAVFGRSIRVKAGRVLVPGGTAAEAVWSGLVGAEPSRPSAFVQRLVRDRSGRLAWFYDSVAHLDPARQRLALAAAEPAGARVEHARDLLQIFEACSPEWQIADRPFTRPNVDPSLVLRLLRATEDGEMAPPANRRLWEQVFKRDEDGSFEEVPRDRPAGEARRVTPAWLAHRIALAPQPLARRRLETVLFAQRVFPNPVDDDAALAAALRGYSAFPALMATLERIGVRTVSVFAGAARHAAALNSIHGIEPRRNAIAQFQSALAIVDRAAHAGSLDAAEAQRLVESLGSLEVAADKGYDGRIRTWIRASLLPALPQGDAQSAHPAEDRVLAAMAGVRPGTASIPAVEWEGHRYVVDPALAELRRLQRVRERQYASTGAQRLDATLSEGGAALEAGRALADTLVAIVYAAHLGEPEGVAAAGGVAARHDFGLADAPGASRTAAWRVPREEFGGKSGWHIVGSVLALETAIGRLALRRLDANHMPTAPVLSTNERNTAILTAALLTPAALSNAARDEIAAAIARGRARVESLTADRTAIEIAARDAGLSEWRREALRWTLSHDRAAALSQFSLLDLFWLGGPKKSARETFDAWGAATFALDGCLCLRMPAADPWEDRAGRAATGQLATRGADVALRVAEALAELDLPATLAPAVVAYAMQEVIDGARPAYFDDWTAVERSARDIPRDRLVDYIAALAADGPLIAAQSGRSQH